MAFHSITSNGPGPSRERIACATSKRVLHLSTKTLEQQMYCDATKQARVDAQILSLDVGTQQTNQRGCLRVLRDAVKL